MARTFTCRTCGEPFEVPEPSERRSGRLPHYCGDECKRRGQASWNAKNRWRYRRPKSLLTLMQHGRRPC